MKQIHIVYKENGEIDFFSKGETFEVNPHLCEADMILSALEQWKNKYSEVQFPNIKIMVIYPLN